jgi:hypothetical protein
MAESIINFQKIKRAPPNFTAIIIIIIGISLLVHPLHRAGLRLWGWFGPCGRALSGALFLCEKIIMLFVMTL